MFDATEVRCDVAVLGAGLSGLVAANYLARAGKRVILIEQTNKAGGCCIPLIRRGFGFDVGAHVLCSMRNDGIINRVLSELDIKTNLRIIETDPTDRIIFPDHTITMHRDLDKTIGEFSSVFPAEADALRNFFIQIKTFSYTSLYAKYRKLTFKNMLDSFFENPKLKEMLKVFLGNIGLPSHEVSALAAIALYKEYVLDNGYYPQGGINRIADLLIQKFIEFGGDIKYLSKVEKIDISGGAVSHVRLSTGCVIRPDAIVSTISPQHLFGHILQDEDVNNKYKVHMSELKPSASVFSVNLALAPSNINDHLPPIDTPVWYCTNYKMDEYLSRVSLGEISTVADQVFCTSSSMYDSNMAPKNSHTLSLFVNAPYQSPEYWKEEGGQFADNIIALASKIINFSRFKILFKSVITPQFYAQYTMNYRGAYKGWASNLRQCDGGIMGHKTEVSNLFQAGHWTTMVAGQGGMPMAVFSGKSAARHLTREIYSADHSS